MFFLKFFVANISRFIKDETKIKLNSVTEHIGAFFFFNLWFC